MSDTRSLIRQVMDAPGIDMAGICRKDKEDIDNGKTVLDFMKEFAAECPPVIPEATYCFPSSFFYKP